MAITEQQSYAVDVVHHIATHHQTSNTAKRNPSDQPLSSATVTIGWYCPHRGRWGTGTIGARPDRPSGCVGCAASMKVWCLCGWPVWYMSYVPSGGGGGRGDYKQRSLNCSHCATDLILWCACMAWAQPAALNSPTNHQERWRTTLDSQRSERTIHCSTCKNTDAEVEMKNEATARALGRLSFLGKFLHSPKLGQKPVERVQER